MFELITLKKLDGYSKPVKTKQLAGRINIDRTIMAEILNRLEDKNLVVWHVPKYDDEKQCVGWIRNRNQPILSSL